MPKIAPSNPLPLKGDREALLQSYKLAKKTYFAVLRATDINRSKGMALRKKVVIVFSLECFLVF